MRGIGGASDAGNASNASEQTSYRFNGAQVQLCLPDGPHELALAQDLPRAFPFTAILSIFLLSRGHLIRLNALPIASVRDFRYTLTTDFPIPPASLATAGRFLVTATPPSDWHQLAFDDSFWDKQVARTQEYSSWVLVRVAFDYAPVPNNGFELTIFSHDGIRVYLNGAFLYENCLENSRTARCASKTATPHVITGSHLALHTGRNVVAVMTPTLSDKFFDIFLQLLPPEAALFPHYLGMEVVQSVGTPALTALCDQDISTTVSAPISAFRAVEFFFPTGHVQPFNRYCIFPGKDPDSFPRDWELIGVSGKDRMKLDRRTQVQWPDAKYRCFDIPYQSRAWPQYALSVLRVVGTADPEATVSLNEVQFFFNDLQNEVEPLAYTPSTLTVLSFFPLPDHVVTSSYTNFTVAPALPYALHIDAVTGLFSVSSTLEQINGLFTVTAADPYGRLASTTITFSWKPCSEPNGGVIIEFQPSADTSPLNYTLTNKATGEVVDSLETVLTSTIHRQLCLPVAFYTLTLNKPDDVNWDMNTVYVRTSDDTAIEALHITGDEAVATLLFYSGYVVNPYEHVWRYSIDSQDNTKWTTGQTTGRNWMSAVGSALRLSANGNGYFYTTFDIPLKEHFIGMEVTVTTGQGVRLYLNGDLLREYCVGKDILYNHEEVRCAVQNLVIKHRSVFFFNWLPLNNTGNHLAIQIVHTNDNNIYPLELYVLYKKVNPSVLINGRCIQSASKDYDDTLLFDNNPRTAFFSTSLPIQHGWTFRTGEGFFTGYRLVADEHCYAVAPTHWRVLGRIHTSTRVEVLHEASYNFTSPQEVFEAHVLLPSSYQIIWLEIDAAPTNVILPARCGTIRYSIADFVPFLDVPEQGCHGDNAFPPVQEGEYSTIACSPTTLYSGSITRLCHAGRLGEEMNTCVPRKPSVLMYPKTNFMIQPNTPLQPIIPTTVGAETEVLTDDKLPRGIMLDPITGTISGTAINLHRNYKVTVVLKNRSGEVSTVLYFYCNDEYWHHRLVVCCFIAGLTMLICIALMYVVRRFVGKRKHLATVTQYGRKRDIKAERINYVGISL